MGRHPLDVAHYLGIYKIRKKMQEDEITNPKPEIRAFTRELVEKLSAMPLDAPIFLEKDGFYDSEKNLILEIPRSKT